jgi:phage-related holin
MSQTPAQPRPSWVRFAVGRSSARSAAFSQIAFLLLNLVFFVVIAVTESASESQLGKIAFAIGLAGIALNVILAFWVWLAVRWVDRNGQWA